MPPKKAKPPLPKKKATDKKPEPLKKKAAGRGLRHLSFQNRGDSSGYESAADSDSFSLTLVQSSSQERGSSPQRRVMNPEVDLRYQNLRDSHSSCSSDNARKLSGGSDSEMQGDELPFKNKSREISKKKIFNSLYKKMVNKENNHSKQNCGSSFTAKNKSRRNFYPEDSLETGDDCLSDSDTDVKNGALPNAKGDLGNTTMGFTDRSESESESDSRLDKDDSGVRQKEDATIDQENRPPGHAMLLARHCDGERCDISFGRRSEEATGDCEESAAHTAHYGSSRLRGTSIKSSLSEDALILFLNTTQEEAHEEREAVRRFEQQHLAFCCSLIEDQEAALTKEIMANLWGLLPKSFSEGPNTPAPTAEECYEAVQIIRQLANAANALTLAVDHHGKKRKTISESGLSFQPMNEGRQPGLVAPSPAFETARPFMSTVRAGHDLSSCEPDTGLPARERDVSDEKLRDTELKFDAKWRVVDEERALTESKATDVPVLYSKNAAPPSVVADQNENPAYTERSNTSSLLPSPMKGRESILAALSTFEIDRQTTKTRLLRAYEALVPNEKPD